jgi:uncharacterized RDD family membrane protein YckC
MLITHKSADGRIRTTHTSTARRIEYSAPMQDKAIAPATAPEAASLFSRLAAAVYELLLVAAVIFITSLPAAPFVKNAPVGWPRQLFQLYLLAILFAYFAAFWRRSGQTLAMKTWRIRLTDRQGDLLDLRRALLRFGLAVVFPVAGMAVASGLGGDVRAVVLGATLGWAFDWLWALVDPDRQFLHDRLAHTRLVRVPRKA